MEKLPPKYRQNFFVFSISGQQLIFVSCNCVMFIHGEVQLELAEINVRHLCIIEIIDVNAKSLATMVSLRRIPGKLDQSRKMRT